MYNGFTAHRDLENMERKIKVLELESRMSTRPSPKKQATLIENYRKRVERFVHEV